MSAHEIIKNAFKEGRKKLLEHEAMKLLEIYEIPIAKYGIAQNEDEAVKIAKDIGYPVVLKIVSPDISHKTDVGGVIVGVKNESELRESFRKILDNVRLRAPNARIAGILIQEMAKPGFIEVIVGATRDPIFGPVIMFGLGGIFVEVLKDVSFRVAPLMPEDADEMVREIKSYKILEGYRGMPPRDIESIREIIMKTSRIMIEIPQIQDIDLNPIMLYEKGKGAIVVDARVIIKS